MSMRYLSSRSDGSDSICATSTPLSSIGSATIEDPGTAKPVVSMVPGWLDTGPGSAASLSMEMPASAASLWDQSSALNFLDSTSPPSDITWGQNMSSPFPISPYDKTIDSSKFSTSLTSDTSYRNSHGTLTSPHPIPDWQVLGMSSGILSETGDKNYSHVPSAGPPAYAGGLVEGTSGLEYFYTLFPDLQYPFTL